MKKAISLILAMAMCLSLLSACGAEEKKPSGGQQDTPQSAQPATDPSNYPTPEKPVTLTLAHTTPETSDMHHNALRFKELVEEGTNGAVKVEIYPNGQLGSEETMQDAMFSDTLDLGILSANVLATTIPELNALVLPFFFDSFEQLGGVFTDDEFYTKTADLCANKGIHYLGMSLIAARGIVNTQRDIHAPEDLKGLKIRVNSGSILKDTFDAMGVTTTQLALGELYTALQQNVIDGMDHGIFAANMLKYTEIGKHFTDLKHYFQISLLVMSDAAWNKLSPEQQEVMRSACEAVEDDLVEVANASDSAAYTEAENDLGVTVTFLSPEEFQVFRDMVQPVYDKYVPMIGEDYYNFVDSLRK